MRMTFIGSQSREGYCTVNFRGTSLTSATKFCCCHQTFVKILKYHFAVQFSMSHNVEGKAFLSAIVPVYLDAKQTDANVSKQKFNVTADVTVLWHVKINTNNFLHVINCMSLTILTDFSHVINFTICLCIMLINSSFSLNIYCCINLIKYLLMYYVNWIF